MMFDISSKSSTKTKTGDSNMNMRKRLEARLREMALQGISKDDLRHQRLPYQLYEYWKSIRTTRELRHMVKDPLETKLGHNVRKIYFRELVHDRFNAMEDKLWQMEISAEWYKLFNKLRYYVARYNKTWFIRMWLELEELAAIDKVRALRRSANEEQKADPYTERREIRFWYMHQTMSKRRGLPRNALYAFKHERGECADGIIGLTYDIIYEEIEGIRWVSDNGTGVASVSSTKVVDKIEEGTIVTTPDDTGAWFFAALEDNEKWLRYWTRYSNGYRKHATAWLVRTKTPTLVSFDEYYSELLQYCAKTIEYVKPIGRLDNNNAWCLDVNVHDELLDTVNTKPKFVAPATTEELEAAAEKMKKLHDEHEEQLKAEMGEEEYEKWKKECELMSKKMMKDDDWDDVD